MYKAGRTVNQSLGHWPHQHYLVPYLLIFISNNAFCHKKNDEQGSVLDVVGKVFPLTCPQAPLRITLANKGMDQYVHLQCTDLPLSIRVLRIVLEISTGLIQEYG